MDRLILALLIGLQLSCAKAVTPATQFDADASDSDDAIDASLNVDAFFGTYQGVLFVVDADVPVQLVRLDDPRDATFQVVGVTPTEIYLSEITPGRDPGNGLCGFPAVGQGTMFTILPSTGCVTATERGATLGGSALFSGPTLDADYQLAVILYPALVDGGIPIWEQVHFRGVRTH